MSQPTRKIGIVLSTAALLTGVTAVRADADTATRPTVTRAQAAPATVTAAGGTAPACIDRSGIKNTPGGGIAGYVYNGCGRTMRIKIVVHYWRDTSCQTIPNKQSRYFHTVGGSYDRTAVC